MFDFLEHCFDVDLLLSSLSECSRKGTLVVIYMPVVEEVTQGLEKVTQHNKYFYHEHLYYFTEAGIIKEMEDRSFRVVHRALPKEHKLLVIFEKT